MCLVAVKYLSGFGFVAVKNREHSYKPRVRIRKSFRNKFERLYLWEEVTRYSEGLNEYGVSILPASGEREDKFKRFNPNSTYKSPVGLRIRKSLHGRTVQEASSFLTSLQVTGMTVVFDNANCIVHTGSFDSEGEYISSEEILRMGDYGVYSDTYSDSDLQEVEFRVKGALNPDDLLSAVSIFPEDSEYRTTGQVMITPKDRTLHFRPLWCKTLYDVETLNSIEQKTYFELVSSRKLISFL